MRDRLEAALDAAVGAGATYADVRAVDNTSEALTIEGELVETLERSQSAGYGVRVLADGAWGYAATSDPDDSRASEVALRAIEVARASATAISRPVELVTEPVHIDSWATPVERDPFSVALEERIALLVTATNVMRRVQGVKVARGTMDLVRQQTWFASSEGSFIDQDIVHTGAGIEATVAAESEVQTRSYPGSFRGHYGAGGYEIVEAMALRENAQRTAE